MRLFLALLFIVGGYYVGLMKLSDLALGQLDAINQTYQHVAVTADEWQQGNTSTSFTPDRHP
jgi:hypothetical protein